MNGFGKIFTFPHISVLNIKPKSETSQLSIKLLTFKSFKLRGNSLPKMCSVELRWEVL